MSRALDKSLKESLKHGDHHLVFLEISNVLIEPSNELLEIELLGKSHILDAHTSVLRDENAVAIPKLCLVQAFTVAQNLLKQSQAYTQRVSSEDISRSTAVILLMDPEHLTAANTRKRLIRDQWREKDLQDRLYLEKHLIDSLLTSRLHRHTKSPTLWNHRRWLMEQYRLHNIDITAEDGLTRTIMTSGERHPRNYYAWCHARYLVNVFILSSSNSREQISHMVIATQKWCFAHHNDISGWQFLLFLLNKQPAETSPVFRETLKLAASFKWRNESVWYFLRLVTARGVATSDKEEFESLRKTLWETASEDSIEKKTLKRAEQWLVASQ
ncbi:prenyltransferase [Fusarium sp. NRRL 52700]|nr:prenyltransferase [Fusarium sp. NRRL 52700]